MHKDRVTKFTRPSDVKWFWPYSVTVSYDKELDPTYFGMMNSVFGKLINVKPAAAEKITSSGKYELKCKKSDKICISHLKKLKPYMPDEKLRENDEFLILLCPKCVNTGFNHGVKLYVDRLGDYLEAHYGKVNDKAKAN